MQETSSERAPARPGRCSIHPTAAEVATCEVCGRALCLACALPVRGVVVGTECLATVLEDAPPPQAAPVLPLPGGDRLALAGFAFVVLLSIFPWSRYGANSRFLGAWSRHWSLLAVGAAAAGLIVALVALMRPWWPAMLAAAYSVLAALMAVGAVLHHNRPPSVAAPSLVPLAALLGSGLVAAGVVQKVTGLLRMGRVPRTARLIP